MSNKVRISPVDQYIIDAIRKTRLKLDISAEDLSKELSPSGSIGFVGNIESSRMKTTYTNENINKIAVILSAHAKANHANDESVKKEYTVYDFYPERPLSDELIDKTNFEIKRKFGPVSSLKDIIISTDFLEEAKTIKQITDFCNEVNNTNWKPNSFTSPVSYAVKNNNLIPVYLKDGTVKYKKTKKGDA